MFDPSLANNLSSKSSESYKVDLLSDSSAAFSNALEKYVEDDEDAVRNADKARATKPVNPMPRIGISDSWNQSPDWEIYRNKEAGARSPLDYAQGLAELQTIMLASEKLLENDPDASRASKRSLELATIIITPREKKARIDSSGSNISMTEEEKLKRLIKQCSRKEIEEMVCEAVLKVIGSNSEIGRLRGQCDRLTAKSIKWKKKAQIIQRHCHELGQVMTKYLIEKRDRPNDPGIAPIQTGSVKLQVSHSCCSATGRSISLDSIDVSSTTAISQLKPLASKSASNTMFTVSSNTNGTDSAQLAVPRKSGNKMIATSNEKPLKPSTSNGLETRKLLPTTVPIANPTVKAKKGPTVMILSDDEDSQETTCQPQLAVVALQGMQNMPRTYVNCYTNPKSQPLTPNLVCHRQVLTNRPPMSRPSSINSILGPQTISSIRTYQARMPLIPGVTQHLTNKYSSKCVPPRPSMTVLRVNSGITLTWDLELQPGYHAAVKSYQVFSLEEGLTSAHWKKIAEVDALALPMTCSLTQFPSSNRYQIFMRAVDMHGRYGEFCEPKVITL